MAYYIPPVEASRLRGVYRFQISLSEQLTTVLTATDKQAAGIVFCVLEDVCGQMFLHYILSTVNEEPTMHFRVTAYGMDGISYPDENALLESFRWSLVNELGARSDMFAQILCDLNHHLCVF